jgi:hypothetical protein
MRRLFAVLLVSLPAVARAQVGSGWVQYNPPSVIHLDGANGIEVSPGDSTMVMNAGATFTNQGGIETFYLHDPISNRAERRIQNTYLTGRRQFEGEVRVSPPTNDESVMQIFGGNSGATTQMIRAYDVAGGTLRKVPGSVVLAENIHGVWIKVNVIHDVAANYVKTYINGKLISTGDGEAMNAGNDGWYHKYGCYGSLRTGTAKVEWRNVKHFRDGTSPTGSDGGADSPPDARPPADAKEAAPDAGSEPAKPDASATGGSSGTGGQPGTGGASGTGGAPGTGGKPGPSATGGSPGGDSTGTGGEEDPGTPPKKSAAKGGCRVGGQGGGGLSVLMLLALLVRRSRRR